MRLAIPGCYREYEQFSSLVRKKARVSKGVLYQEYQVPAQKSVSYCISCLGMFKAFIINHTIQHYLARHNSRKQTAMRLCNEIALTVPGPESSSPPMILKVLVDIQQSRTACSAQSPKDCRFQSTIAVLLLSNSSTAITARRVIHHVIPAALTKHSLLSWRTLCDQGPMRWDEWLAG